MSAGSSLPPAHRIGARNRAFRAGRPARGAAGLPGPPGPAVPERDDPRRRALSHRLPGHALRQRLLRSGVASLRSLRELFRSRQGRASFFLLRPFGAGRDRDAFRTRFWEASAQRLMQALGAYGFLGLKKGLAVFFAHIPSGLANLIQASGKCRSLPLLHDLAASCRDPLPVTASSTP